MQQVISSERVPIKLWLREIEEDTLQQAKNLANLPFAFKHIAIMADAHFGYGMPIGGVLATKEAIIPNAVGVDIGCGISAVKSTVDSGTLSQERIKRIMSEIRAAIPLGFKHHKRAVSEELMPQEFDIDKLPIVKEQYRSALRQLGTLGGGNHFIELQRDSESNLWIMIHSGSRNVGFKVAEHYNREAKRNAASLFPSVNPKWDLAPLLLSSAVGQTYFQEMNFCLSFAFASRKLMIQRVMEIVSKEVAGIDYEPIINIAHNYAAEEEHFGEQVILHRKGATSAFKGEIGIIPGSQGTNSYIVEGLGNPESFKSCSHGAGRVMSRKKAIRELNLEEEIKKLDEKGILHSIRNRSDLEEATSAYKEIGEVMELQRDLVTIKTELSPLAVIKG